MYKINIIPELPSHLCKALTIKDKAIVVVALLDQEIQFTTFEGNDVNAMYENEFEGFIYTGKPFTLKDMVALKDMLLSMLKDYFNSNIGGFIKYKPTCSVRDKMYMKYLEKSGYTCIGYGEGEYLITYPY